ncbi:hypothetical protein PISL3812_08555 [Talaromyces islandicus]|uniref:Uncharacterized protein n=1 Tax=Talaromyces islandicus TaxID=28573 RepID=A0A0U1M9B9_TALIS|nr:hypothetical protein PISL3812_08555 [Talaromyces islandicus]
MFPINTAIGNNSGIAPGSWRDSYSGKSSPDILRHSSSYSSQNAFDTPVSEPATPDGHLVLPKLRTPSTRVSVKPHIRNRPPRDERLSTSIDLSRSSLELEGLGIYTNLERDSRFSQPRNSVSSHYPRSITEIASNTTRIGQTYVHPRRQVPTSLTPSLSESPRCSIDEGYFSTTNGSLSGFDTVQTPVLDEDSRSFRELKTARTFSADFSSPNKSSAIQRTNTDVTSLMRGGSWKRLSKRQTLPDSTARAAAVHAARIAFEEKEANKGKKVEVLRKKAPERESHRNNNNHNQQSPNRSPKQTFNDESPLQVEKSSRRASLAAHFTTSSPHDNEEGPDIETKIKERPQTDGAEVIRIRSQSPVGNANNWVRFMTWSRTRYYKAKRRVSSSHFAVR